MVTATKKGAAVLDQHIPDDIKEAYHVLQVVCGFVYPLFWNNGYSVLTMHPHHLLLRHNCLYCSCQHGSFISH
jgi:hypothetical protein